MQVPNTYIYIFWLLQAQIQKGGGARRKNVLIQVHKSIIVFIVNKIYIIHAYYYKIKITTDFNNKITFYCVLHQIITLARVKYFKVPTAYKGSFQHPKPLLLASAPVCLKVEYTVYALVFPSTDHYLYRFVGRCVTTTLRQSMFHYIIIDVHTAGMVELTLQAVPYTRYRLRLGSYRYIQQVVLLLSYSEI